MTSDEPSMYLELSFRPNLEMISVVRRFVADVHRKIELEPDLGARVALAAHELLENAVKYSKNGFARIRVEVLRRDGTDQVLIRTWNQTRPGQVELLRHEVDELGRAVDPLAYYQQLMFRSMKRVDGSGLGLARIRAEGEMSIRIEMCENDEVCVVAQTNAEARLH